MGGGRLVHSGEGRTGATCWPPSTAAARLLPTAEAMAAADSAGEQRLLDPTLV
jgi:hypothetical protein